jgi:hypothetical protein
MSSLPRRRNSSRPGRTSPQWQQRQTDATYKAPPGPLSQLPPRRLPYVSPPSPTSQLSSRRRPSVSSPVLSPRSQIKSPSQRRLLRQDSTYLVTERSYAGQSCTRPVHQTAIQAATSALDHNADIHSTEFDPVDFPRVRRPQIPSYEHFLAQARARAAVADTDPVHNLETRDSEPHRRADLPLSLRNHSSPRRKSRGTSSSGRISPASPYSSSRVSPRSFGSCSPPSPRPVSPPRFTQHRVSSSQTTPPLARRSEQVYTDSADLLGTSSSRRRLADSTLRLSLIPAPLNISHSPSRRRQPYQTSPNVSPSHPSNPNRNRLILRPSRYIGHDAMVPRASVEEEARMTMEANVRAMQAFTAVTREEGLVSGFSSDSDSDEEGERGRGTARPNSGVSRNSRNGSRCSTRSGGIPEAAGGILRRLSRRLSKRGRK